MRVDIYLNREGSVEKILADGKKVDGVVSIELNTWIRDDVYIHTPSGYMEKIRCYVQLKEDDDDYIQSGRK